MTSSDYISRNPLETRCLASYFQQFSM